MRAFADRGVLLFDLDGTLIDSAPDLGAAIDDVLAEHGGAPLSGADVRAFIGDGAAMLVRRAFAARGLGEKPGALPRFRERYDARCLERTRPYAGMPELLERLAAQGRRAAVVTNKPTPFAEKILAGLGLSARLAAVVGPELAAAKKPDPAHVRAALERLGAAPEDAVMIGDGPTDMAAGRLAGCATIACLWGYRGRSELEREQPTAWAATPEQLAALL